MEDYSDPSKLHCSEWRDRALPSSHSKYNKMLRVLWGLVYIFFFRPSPRFLYIWRRIILRLFGASVGKGAVVHPSVKIWAPWNLEVGDYAAIGPDVDLYSVDRVSIGDYSVISQRAFICCASHDYRYLTLPLTTKPVAIGRYAWVCADALLAPGVMVGDYAVVLARSVVTKSVGDYAVVFGHPAVKVRDRLIVG